ncbi:MAG: DUF1844 domain-containing protein [Sandaracinaceae bacterium]|nr:DUF1844 domain-containing protein [Sandaracinaceae bacterium]
MSDERAIPPIDFTTFVLSLSTACMAQLGEVEGPDGGETDLPMAQQSIEILEMLEEKTSGNLTGEEERILEQVLTDLKQVYADKGGA